MTLFKATEIRQNSNIIQEEIETSTMNLENQLRQDDKKCNKKLVQITVIFVQTKNLQKNKLNVQFMQP